MGAVFLKEGQILFLKGSCPMMFEVLLDIMDRFLNLRDTNAECAIALLPSKVLLGWRCPRHFVPGYDRMVPPGPFATGFS
jgi:hypothetical protein